MVHIHLAIAMRRVGEWVVKQRIGSGNRYRYSWKGLLVGGGAFLSLREGNRKADDGVRKKARGCGKLKTVVVRGNPGKV